MIIIYLPIHYLSVKLFLDHSLGLLVEEDSSIVVIFDPLLIHHHRLLHIKSFI